MSQPLSADDLVRVLVSRGCRPLTQDDCHELRDAVHETVHVLQCNSRTYEREALHERLVAKARRESRGVRSVLGDERTRLVRYELEARAVEMLACEHFQIPYDVEAWASIMWFETAKSLRVNLGDVNDVREAIIIASKRLPAQRMWQRVLALRPKRVRRVAIVAEQGSAP